MNNNNAKTKVKTSKKSGMLFILLIFGLIICCILSSVIGFVIYRSKQSTNDTNTDKPDTGLPNSGNTGINLGNTGGTNPGNTGTNPGNTGGTNPEIPPDPTCAIKDHDLSSHVLGPPHDQMYNWIKNKKFGLINLPISTFQIGQYYPETTKMSVSVDGATPTCKYIDFSDGEANFVIKNINSIDYMLKFTGASGGNELWVFARDGGGGWQLAKIIQ